MTVYSQRTHARWPAYKRNLACTRPKERSHAPRYKRNLSLSLSLCFALLRGKEKGRSDLFISLSVSLSCLLACTACEARVKPVPLRSRAMLVSLVCVGVKLCVGCPDQLVACVTEAFSWPVHAPPSPRRWSRVSLVACCSFRLCGYQGGPIPQQKGLKQVVWP